MDRIIRLDESGYGIRRDGNWTKFGVNDRWHYTPPYAGPNNPPPVVSPKARQNMSNRSEYRTHKLGASSRPVMLDMKPDGSYNIMKQGKGKSLPGYKPVASDLRSGTSLSPVAKGLMHIGLAAIRRANPYVTAASIAFDLAMDYYKDKDLGWVKTEVQPEVPPVPAHYDLVGAGWYECSMCGDWDSYYVANQSCRPIGANCGAQGTSYLTASGDIALKPTDTQIHVGKANFPGRPWWALARGYINKHPGGKSVIPWVPATPGQPAISATRPVPASAPPRPAFSESVSRPDKHPAFVRRNHVNAINIPLSGGARQPPYNGTHVKAPPAGRTRERKRQVDRNIAYKFIAALYDLTTEADEIVDILYDALGKKCPGARGMAAKANCVYKNINTLDIDEAVLNIVKNHYEDKVYGRVWGALGKYTPYGSIYPGSAPNFRIKGL